MSLEREQLLRQANAVLDWNRTHLNQHSVLTEALVGDCFAEHFVVEPNGRHYSASRADYLAFLNGMKAGMVGIDYDVDHALVDGDAVTLSMRAHIGHSDGRREHFRAMLLMRFDDAGKVVLWHEVYVPLPAAT